MSMLIVADQKLIWLNYSIFDLDNFEVNLQHRVAASLRNQLLPVFQAIDLKHCADAISLLKVCMWLLASKNIFWRNFGIFDSDNFEVEFQ